MASHLLLRNRFFYLCHHISSLIRHTNKGFRCLSYYPAKKYNGFKYEPLSQCFHTSFSMQKKVSFLLADIGEGIREVVIKEWYVQEGDKIAEFDNVCEVQSDKASVTITSRYNGTIQKIFYEVDEIALVGKPLLDIEVEKEESSSGTVGDAVQEGEAIALSKPVVGGHVSSDIQLPQGRAKIIATPAVRRISMEYKVDLSKVSGSGRDGRILKEDVLNYVQGKDQSPPMHIKTPLPQQPSVPTPLKSVAIPTTLTSKSLPAVLKEDRVEKIKGYKRAMVKTMTASMQIPHFGYCDEVDMTMLMSLKEELKTILLGYNLHFSFMPFFIKAVSMALMDYPILNASVDENCEKITLKASHNIGIAMDTSEGLVVPNIKSVQQRSIFDITEELGRLQQCGQRGNFSTQDISGGTFTISNIGSIGGTYAKPLILPPEVAIGAIGKIRRLPRFGQNEQVIGAQIMEVSWSADHRVIDGATMARFSNRWKAYLEKPSSMILYLK